MTGNSILLRGQGADNIDRPHSDAGGFAKREHMQVFLDDGQVLKSPSWWRGCKRDRVAAAKQLAEARNADELIAIGWR